MANQNDSNEVKNVANDNDSNSESVFEDNKFKANQIIMRNIYWSSGMGLIPVPLFDLVAVTGFQVKMIRELTNLYDIPFSKSIVKSMIGSLVGGASSLGLSKMMVGSFIGSFLRGIPGGNIINGISLPIMAGATTYAVGKVFLMHFESGGTLLNFNPDKMKEHFATLYQKGKATVSSKKGEQAA